MDVVCLGILVADAVSSPIDVMPAAGQLKFMDRYTLSVGGCAANAAVSLRRLGRSVKVLGKVGEDLFGDFVLRDLEREGVETSGIVRSRTHQTSATLIVNVRGEDRRFVHCMGANADFRLDDVPPGAMNDARVLYVGGYMAMPRFDGSDLSRLFEQAKRKGLITVLDVVIAAGSDTGMVAFEQALAYTDVFLPNDDEARIITGRSDPAEQAEAISRVNPACTVVITMGARGVLVLKDGRLLQAGRYLMDTVDPSGAGDAFTAGFIVGVLEGWPLADTVRFASAIGASSTRALGCTASVFTMDEAQHFVAQNKIEVEEIPRPAARARR